MGCLDIGIPVVCIYSCSCFLGVLGIELELPYIGVGFSFFDRGVLLFPRIYP